MNEFTAPARDRTLAWLRIADVLIVLLVGYGCWLLRERAFDLPAITAEFLGYAGLLSAVAFHSARVYEPSQLRLMRGAVRIAAGWGLTILLLFSVGFITKSTGSLSRIWIALWFLTVPLLLLGLRLVLSRFSRHRIQVAVVGEGPAAARFLEHVKANMADELEVIGLFTEPGAPTSGHPVAGNVEALLQTCRTRRVDRVVVALPWEQEERILRLTIKLRTLPVDVDLAPCSIAYRVDRPRLTLADGLPMLSLNRRPLEGWSAVVKQVEDKTLALLLILFISPVLMLLALAVKISSPGPVIFRQLRYGYNNALITVYKFRSMRTDVADDPLVTQAQRNDPRVTRLGAILRRYSLDELPQLFNVLNGTMSLVGPRPHAVPHNLHYGSLIDEYAARHNMRPGITGWAQVNGFRGETTSEDLMRKRVEYDLYYIRNWSLRLDLLILLRTAWFGFTSDQAY